MSNKGGTTTYYVAGPTVMGEVKKHLWWGLSHHFLKSKKYPYYNRLDAR
jgi:hypothetical protein